MKYIVIIGDGMSGWPSDSKDGKTALELANIPNLDLLASKGEIGLVKNTPDNLPPGSDVCNLSVFGYNPAKYYTGRAPIEAVAQGIELGDEDTVFRANLVTIENGKMKDFTAGHISNKDGKDAICALNKMIEHINNMKFFSGVSYRNLLKVEGEVFNIETTPPHDISGQGISDYLPKGMSSSLIKEIMEKSLKIMPINIQANMVWLWGQGTKLSIPNFESVYGLKGGVITAVDLIKGLGFAAGMDYVSVPGITGFVDTNYEGKARYAIEALKNYDIVFIHVEAPDEAGHLGDLNLKIKAIEDFDNRVIGTILSEIGDINYKILILPDHSTPIEIKTHSADLVPYIIYDSSINQKNKDAVYTEKYAQDNSKEAIIGHELMGRFIK